LKIEYKHVKQLVQKYTMNHVIKCWPGRKRK